MHNKINVHIYHLIRARLSHRTRQNNPNEKDSNWSRSVLKSLIKFFHELYSLLQYLLS